MRIVDRDELDARLLQAEQEVSVPGQTVEPSNHQLGVEGAAGFKSTSERRAIVIAFAALDLDVLLRRAAKSRR